MPNEFERMQILEMIENGKISTAEGLQLLQSMLLEEQANQPVNPDPLQDDPSLSGAFQDDHTGAKEVWNPGEPQSQIGPTVTGEVYSHPSGAERIELPPDAENWRRWWVIALWIGVGVAVTGGTLMYVALQSTGIGFWFMCAGLLFTFGLTLIVLGWQSRSARWLHLRIQQHPGHTPAMIALSFPLPIRSTAWFFRTFRNRIPGMQNTSIDEVILALEHSTTSDNPLYISINDEDDDENIQIFIG